VVIALKVPVCTVAFFLVFGIDGNCSSNSICFAGEGVCSGKHFQFTQLTGKQGIGCYINRVIVLLNDHEGMLCSEKCFLIPVSQYKIGDQ
jgi:hypothetical protein